MLQVFSLQGNQQEALLSTIRHKQMIVAIPAKDEAYHIEKCLRALSIQQMCSIATSSLSSFSVVLLVNNSTDATLDIAGRLAPTLPFHMSVLEHHLPKADAHAGGARRAAMDAAAHAAVDPDAIICTTDADSEVSPTWLFDIRTAIENGADAVAGVVEFAPARRGDPPFPASRRLEDRYATLQAEVIARADPEPHNPWPNHFWAWGANFALTLSAYKAIGGLPSQPLAEDRALAAALRAHDFKLRHSLDVRVRTSRRDQGRAPGGLADLIRFHQQNDSHPCDAELEPILTAFARARIKRDVREAWKSGGDHRLISRRLGLEADFVIKTLGNGKFGAAWLHIERASPILHRVRLSPDHLPLEIARAEQLLVKLRPTGANDQADTLRAASAGLWSAEALPA